MGGRVNLLYNWMEYLFLVLLIIGFFLSLSAGSAVITYTVIIFIGILAGRAIYENRKGLNFPVVIIIIGFILGYIFGAWITRYGNAKVIVLLFIISYAISYYAHQRKWIS